MVWNITRNERSAETKREVEERRRGDREEQKFNAATRLAEEKKKQKQNRDRFAVQCRQTGLQETAGAIRRPAGAGQHSVAFNQDQEAL